MSATLTFWKRVEDLFRPRTRTMHDKPGRVGFAGVALDGKPAERRNTGDSGPLAPWSRWRGRHAELRENFLKVSESLDRMHEHFERTEQRNENLDDTLLEIRTALAEIAGQQTRQHDVIDQIAARLSDLEARGAQVSKALQELPPALRAQADAVQSVSGQLDTSRETDASLRASLDNFETAAREMRETGAVQLETLSRLQQDQEGSRDQLTTALSKQNRRFLWVAITASVLSLAALGALVANLVAAGLMPLSRVLADS